jgi:hypothetical protein
VGTSGDHLSLKKKNQSISPMRPSTRRRAKKKSQMGFSAAPPVR